MCSVCSASEGGGVTVSAWGSEVGASTVATGLLLVPSLAQMWSSTTMPMQIRLMMRTVLGAILNPVLSYEKYLIPVCPFFVDIDNYYKHVQVMFQISIYQLSPHSMHLKPLQKTAVSSNQHFYHPTLHTSTKKKHKYPPKCHNELLENVQLGINSDMITNEGYFLCFLWSKFKQILFIETKSIKLLIRTKLPFLLCMSRQKKVIFLNFVIIQIEDFMSTSKKKSQLATILDELRCEDPKKRLAAVREVKEVAAALGPSRVRSELIGFLAQFIDDEESIMLELLSQLEGFTALVGGPEHEKSLVPLLISFCKTDEKKVAFQSGQLILRIVQGNKELSLEVIKKLMKTDMNVTKECGVQLIAGLLPQLESSQATLMEMYTPLFTSDSPQLKIIAAKYLYTILKNLKGREEVNKLLEHIYSDGGELQKIHGLNALVEYYGSNNNFVLTKFKHLAILNSWRINIRICELAPVISEKITKAHFKLIFEPIYLKFMTSSQPELRSAACQTITAVCKYLGDDEHKSKLQPILKKLAGDQVDFVKVELSKNIVPLCGSVNPEFMCECILPIIMFFIKDPNSQIALGIVKNLDLLTTKITKEILDDKIVKPLLQQLATDNWRVKCEIIDVLKQFLTHQTFLNETVLKVFVALPDDRIDAVRLKANELLIEVLAKNSKEWCEQHVVARLFDKKQNASYIKKQNLLHLIEKTAHCVSDRVLKDVYQHTIVHCLNDKVSNVRLKSINVLKSTARLSNPTIDKQLEKLKDDKDNEVRQLAKKLRS